MAKVKTESTEKKCICDNLDLMRRTAIALDVSMNEVMAGKPYKETSQEPEMKELAVALLNNLEKELKTEKYEGLREQFIPQFTIMRAAVAEMERGENCGSRALDLVRNQIHNTLPLHQMLTCGPPLMRKNKTKATEVVTKYLDTLEDGNPLDALKLVEQYYKSSTCESI